MLINSEPLAVSKAFVDSKGISVIKQIMECPRPGKAQLSMLSIIAGIEPGKMACVSNLVISLMQ